MPPLGDILDGTVRYAGDRQIERARYGRAATLAEEGAPSVASEPALTTGKVTLRPWRVGVVVDATNTAAVRDAIRALSGAWGGIYMPLFDVNDGIEKLKEQAATFDVDSLYSDIEDEDLQKFLRSPGWAWQGRGQYGPLVENTESSIRHSVLRWDELVSSGNHVQPQWPEDDPDELAYAAMYGLPRAEAESGPTVAEAGLGTHTSPGLIHKTANHLRLIGAEHREQPQGVLVLRSGNARDVIDYWNLRAMGVDVTAVPSGASSDTWEALLTGPLPTQTWKSGGPNPTSWEVLSVCGAEGAPAALLDLLNARAARLGATVRHEEEVEVSWPRGAFPGVTTRFTRSFSQDSRPTAQSIDVRLPELPLVDSPSAYLRGVIAAEIRPHAAQGHDPRFTAAIPPYRRHSELLEHAANLSGVRQRRSTAGGQVMGVDATTDVAPVVFAFNLDVFQRLFDDPSVEVSQSDIGKFQSRAAERLGGPFGGVFNQPGARAVLSETAKKGEGIHMDHMRRTFANHKGTWPGWLIGDEKDYSPGEVNRLLNTGLFVPTSRVHCAHCRVDR